MIKKLKTIWYLLWAKRFLVVAAWSEGHIDRYHIKGLNANQMCMVGDQVGQNIQDMIDMEEGLAEAKNILNGL